MLDTFGRREELLGLVEAYRRLKRDLGLMDFSDQIELGARLADEQPEVGAAEREKFRVVLLDEYQDTSVAQAPDAQPAVLRPDARAGRGHPVTAVGDPNQAIYGWRGASVSNILGFGADFPPADGSTDVPSYPLTVNRRSDARILQARQRRSPRRSTRRPTSGRAARAAAGRRAGDGAGGGARDVRRRARPGCPTQVRRRARGDADGRRGARSAC